MLHPRTPSPSRATALPCGRLPPVVKSPAVQTQAQPLAGFGSAGEGLRRERGTWVRDEAPGTGDMAMGTKGVLGHHSLLPRLASGQSRCPLLLSPPLSVLEAPPGLGRGELVHIPHLVVGLVAHGEEELVAEANLLLLGVGEEQDLGDS